MALVEHLREPYCRTTEGGKGCNLYALGIFDQFKVRLRVAFIGGTILASPIWLYELGAYITPALHKKERRYAAGFLITALLLFLAGTVMAFEFPAVILFLNVVGVLSSARMREWRRGMIFGIFVASALITPTQDPFTFLAADPLAALDPDTQSYVDTRPSSL